MSDNNGYTLRLPFRLPPSQQFSNLDKPLIHDCGGLRLKLGKNIDQYFISASTFPDEATARDFLPKLWAGLMWTTLNRGLSVEVRLSLQEVVYAERPAESLKKLFNKDKEFADGPFGLMDSSLPAVFRNDGSVKMIGAERIRVTVKHPPSKTMGFIEDALSLSCIAGVFEDEKLKVALDLYNVSFRESSSSTRFLTLTMALEALMPSELKHECVVALIGRWVAEAKELQDSFERDSDEWEAYDSLIREIGFRKEKSIRSSIRKLVFTTLQREVDPEAEQLSRQAVKLYDMRSRLVHDGYVPENDLRQAVTSMRDIVTRVLKVRFLQAAQIS